MLTPHAVLFDWDNTLIDSWEIIHHALNETFKFYQRSLWTLEDVKVRCHHSCREYFPSLFQDQWQKAASYFYQKIDASHLERLKILPYADELLNFLYQRKIPMAIVSNKRSDILKKEIDHLGWSYYFQTIIGSGDAKYDKPKPDPILLAIHAMGLKSSPHHWYVGDTQTDWLSAFASGCQPIALGTDPRSFGNPLFNRIPYIKDCQELSIKISDFL